MKTLKDFTPEIKARIPEYHERAFRGVFDGGRYRAFNRADAYKAVCLQYEKCGYKSPVMIVAENPYEAQLLFNFIQQSKFWQIIIALIRENDLKESELGSKLGSELGSKLGSELRSKLWSKLGSKLWSELGSKLGSELRSKLWSKLGSKLWSKLGSKLGSELESELGSKLESELGSKLGSKLGSELESELRSKLRSELWSELGSKLRSELGSELESELGSELGSKKKSGSLKLAYHYDYLFTLNVYSSAFFAYYNFIAKEFNIKADINAELEIFSTAYENSNIYSAIFSEAVCVVSKFPKRIYRNANNDLHNPTGPAVDWASYSDLTKWECYYINGRNLPPWIWHKAAADKITKEDFLKEKNSEIKGGIYGVMGQRRMMAMLGAVETDKRTIVHTNGELEEVTLLKTKQKFEEIDNQPFAWVQMVCPSTGTTYLQGVQPHHNNAVDAIASLSMFRAKEYAFDLRS